MSVDGPNAERRGFLPNPNETIPPQTEREAFTDAIRYMGTIMPREQVKELVEGMDSVRVVNAVQGRPVGHSKSPLNPVELYLGTTLDWCIREGLVRSPIMAIGMLESVRQEVLAGGVFVGQEVRIRIPLFQAKP